MCSPHSSRPAICLSAVSLLADLDERRSHNDFVGLPVSLKACMLRVVSTVVLHTSRSQLVLSKGVLKP